jgi:hypothetical protein
MTGSPFPNELDQETEASVSPRTAITPIGAPGKPAGITGTEGAEIGDSPTSVVAETVNE